MAYLAEGEELVTQQEISTYEMPIPAMGQIVLWYPHCIIDKNRARVAFVTRVRNGSISLVDAFQSGRDGVKHASDPRLRMNNDQRADGCWDFTDEHVNLTDLRRRIEALELAVPDATEYTDTPRESPGKSRSLTVLWKLRRQCRDLGVGDDAWQALTKDEALAFIASKHATPVE